MERTDAVPQPAASFYWVPVERVDMGSIRPLEGRYDLWCEAVGGQPGFGHRVPDCCLVRGKGIDPYWTRASGYPIPASLRVTHVMGPIVAPNVPSIHIGPSAPRTVSKADYDELTLELSREAVMRSELEAERPTACLADEERAAFGWRR